MMKYQLFTRYTKSGEWILDPFMGSGTSHETLFRGIIRRKSLWPLVDGETVQISLMLVSLNDTRQERRLLGRAALIAHAPGAVKSLQVRLPGNVGWVLRAKSRNRRRASSLLF